MNPVIKAGVISLIVNLFLVGLKAGLAWLSGSISVMSDAIHSASDAVVSLLVIANCYLTQRSKSKKALYAQYLMVLLVAAGIVFAGIEVIKRSLLNPVTLKYPWITLGGTGLSIIVAELIARYKIAVGDRHDAPSLTADGYHSRADAMSSIAVFIAVGGQVIGVPLDRIVGFAIGVLLFGVAAQLVWSVIDGILRRDIPDPVKIDTLIHNYIKALSLKFWSFIKQYKRRLAVVLALILFSIWVIASSTVVRPGQKAYLEVLGRPVGGFHGPGVMVLLWPFITAQRFSPDLVQRVEVGFSTSRPEVSNLAPRLWGSRHMVVGYKRIPSESLNITGDANIVDAALVVHFHIRDLKTYVHRVKDPSSLVKAAVRYSFARVSSNMDIASLLVDKRKLWLDQIKDIVQQVLNNWKSGLVVDSVLIHDLHPPVDVVPSFRDVFSAQEDVAVQVNTAKAYRNAQLPMAAGKAYKRVRVSMAKAVDLVEGARGMSDQMLIIFTEMKKNIEFAKFDLKLKELTDVLRNRKIILLTKGVPHVRVRGIK